MADDFAIWLRAALLRDEAEAKRKSKVPCADYQQGSCKNPNCIYPHPTALCKQFSKTGTCPKGDHCKYLHGARSRSAARQLPILISERKASGIVIKDAGKLSGCAWCGRLVEQHQFFCSAQCEKADAEVCWRCRGEGCSSCDGSDYWY
jgi:hypothetical protein